MDTLKAFRDACNYISKIAFETRIFNPVVLHHMTYRDTRQKFNLPANLAIRARDRVAKAYKQRKRRLLKFTKLSMDLDERLFRLIYKPDGIYASVSTVQKRVKPPLDIGKYQRKLLEDTKPTHAVLVYRDKTFFLHVTINKIIPEPKGSNPVGVDVGMNNLLVASNGFKVKGKAILRKRQRFRGLRASLQKRGTKSAKRHLKRLSRTEKIWINTVLHQISREFINSLQEGDIVVMEDLRGIRGRAKHRKSLNGMFHSWAFDKLQFFIEYKAFERGIPVEYVNPTNTSQTCPRCGHIDKANRIKQALFRCGKCGFQHNADMVASLNLSKMELAPLERASVNEPYAGINGFNHYDSPASPSALAVGS